MATHHPDRCRGVANLCFALSNLVPLVDRELYPETEYPVGQWDYWLLHREHFARTVGVFESDVRATFSASYRAGSQKGGRQTGGVGRHARWSIMTCACDR